MQQTVKAQNQTSYESRTCIASQEQWQDIAVRLAPQNDLRQHANANHNQYRKFFPTAVAPIPRQPVAAGHGTHHTDTRVSPGHNLACTTNGARVGKQRSQGASERGLGSKEGS